MTAVDITADLNDEDDTGYVWTFPDEARDPSVAVPGAIVVAGIPDAPTVAEVFDLATKPAGTVVHLRVLPGSVSDYAAAVFRHRLCLSPSRPEIKWRLPVGWRSLAPECGCLPGGYRYPRWLPPSSRPKYDGLEPAPYPGR